MCIRDRALGPEKKNPGISITGTGLVDPVRDGKFPGNSLMGTGENQESGLPKAPGPWILAWTLSLQKIPFFMFPRTGSNDPVPVSPSQPGPGPKPGP